MVVFAQWQREVISENTATALGYKRQRRQVYGHVPFGWRREGEKLVEVAVEQAALIEMRRMDAEGATLRLTVRCSNFAACHRAEASVGSAIGRAVLRSKIAKEAAA